VLSQIEENRKKAQRAEKKKMQSVVHEFVEKQIKAIGNRDKNLEEKHKEMQEELKKHREKIKNAIEAKKEHEKKVAKKIKEENKKARTKLQKIQESRQEMMEKIKLKGMAFEEHRHQVLDAHEAIIDHFVGLRDQAHGGREPSDEHSGESQDD
jgi:chromosome segregation ATPase